MKTPTQIRSHLGLRGVAALLVVAYHLQFGGGHHLAAEDATPFLRRSYLLVDLFFILSGFIISYANQADRARAVSGLEFRNFMARRLIRLYPLLAFTLLYLVAFRLALTLAYGAFGRPAPVDWSMPSLSILAAQFLILNAWLPNPNGWNVPSWSISAELFAYLLFPLFVALRASRPRGAMLVMAATALTFYAMVAATSGSLDIIGGWAPIRCVAGFSLGMMIYLVRGSIARQSHNGLKAAQLIAVAGAIVVLATSVNDVLIIPAFAVLVLTTWTDIGPVTSLLARRAALYLGEISYSIYLNHVPILSIASIARVRIEQHVSLPPDIIRLAWLVASFATVILVSHFTYRCVEVPARRLLTVKLLGTTPRPIETSPPGP